MEKQLKLNDDEIKFNIEDNGDLEVDFGHSVFAFWLNDESIEKLTDFLIELRKEKEKS